MENLKSDNNVGGGSDQNNSIRNIDNVNSATELKIHCETRVGSRLKE